MLRIRLQRVGRKKAPSYRLIVSERSKDPYAGGIEILGHYNPVAEPKILELKADRIKHWLSVGAQPSNTVANLLIREGIMDGSKKKSIKISKKRQKKLDDKHAAAKEAEEARKAAEAEKAAAEAEAAKQAEAEAKAAEEAAKVEETPAEKTPDTAETPAEEEAAPAAESTEDAPAEETPEEEKEA